MGESHRTAGLWARVTRSDRDDRQGTVDPEPHWRARTLPHGENGLTDHEFAHVLGMGRVSPLFQRHRP